MPATPARPAAPSRLQEVARNFAKTEMIPRAVHHDRTGEYPMDVFKKGALSARSQRARLRAQRRVRALRLPGERALQPRASGRALVRVCGQRPPPS